MLNFIGSYDIFACYMLNLLLVELKKQFASFPNDVSVHYKITCFCLNCHNRHALVKLYTSHAVYTIYFE